SDTLRAFDGDLHGGLRFGPGKKTDDIVMNWTKTNQFVSWPVRLNPGISRYEVTVHYDADAGSAGNTFRVDFVPNGKPEDTTVESIVAVVKAGKAQSTSVGMLHFRTPLSTIVISPVEIKDGELFRLRSVELKPVNVDGGRVDAARL